jgi:hypothetical protein
LRIAAASTAFALVLALGARPAHADPGDPPSVANSTRAKITGTSLRGFDVLATAGWGASTANIRQLKLEPYGTSFGLDFGYTWESGFRLGGYFADSLGQVVAQHRDPRRGPEDDFNTDTSSLNGGLSIGWAVPVYALMLRYTLNFGVTAMRWEIPANVAARSVSIGDGTSPTIGLHFAPGVALLWPYRWFEAGIGYEYLAQVKDTIPSGFVGKLLIGVRL